MTELELSLLWCASSLAGLRFSSATFIPVTTMPLPPCPLQSLSVIGDTHRHSVAEQSSTRRAQTPLLASMLLVVMPEESAVALFPARPVSGLVFGAVNLSDFALGRQDFRTREVRQRLPKGPRFVVNRTRPWLTSGFL